MANNKAHRVSGPIDTNFSDDKYPTHFSWKGRGGPFFANDLEQMLQIPVDRLELNCECTVSENPFQGVARTVYKLIRLPYIEQGDVIGENPVYVHPEPAEANQYTTATLNLDSGSPWFYLNFWKVQSRAEDFEGEYQEQYAPDYDGDYYVNLFLPPSNRPPFPYETNDPDWHAANWSDTQNENHKWKRFRFGSLMPWSRPFQIFGDYTPGDYIDRRFTAVLNSAEPPQLPPMFLGTTLNNNPAGWVDKIPLPPSSATHTIWEIRAPKNVYGQLKGPWTGPFKVVQDANLLRFSESGTPDPNTIVDTNTSAASGTPGHVALLSYGWSDAYSPERSKYTASRKDNGDGTYTPWIVSKFVGEDGRWVDFRYRDFPKKLINYILTNPDEIWEVADGGDGKPFRPSDHNPANWADKPNANVQEGYVTFEIQAEKYFTGELVDKWSDPIPKSSEDLYLAVITSDKGNSFKANPNLVTQRQYTDIKLTASLYRGKQLLNGVETITYQWTRIYNNGSADTTSFGVARDADINHADVEGMAIFQCVQTLNDGHGNTQIFTQTYELTDNADGKNAQDLRIHAESYLFSTTSAGTSPASVKLFAKAFNLVTDDVYTWEYKSESDPGYSPIGAENTDEYILTNTDFLSHLNGSDKSVTYRVSIFDQITSTSFFDEVTLFKIVVSDGQASFTVLLDNETQIVSAESDGSVNDLSLLKTGYKILEGSTDITSDYDNITTNVVKVTDGPSVNVAVNVNTGTKTISITDWGDDVKEALVEITFEDLGAVKPTLLKTWKLTRQLGLSNFYQVIIESDTGFTFLPDETDPKTLEAVVFKDGVPQSSLTPYTFEWEDESGNLDPEVSSSTKPMDPAWVNFRNSVKLTLRLTATNQALAQARVDIIDIPDAVGRDFVYYSGSVLVAPNKPDEEYGYYSDETLENIGALPQYTGLNFHFSDNPLKQGEKVTIRTLVKNIVWGVGGSKNLRVRVIKGDATFQDFTDQGFNTEGGIVEITMPFSDVVRIKIDNLAPILSGTLRYNVHTSWTPLIKTDTKWRSEKPSDKDKTFWSDPFLIGGEKGAAGQNGGFYVKYFAKVIPGQVPLVGGAVPKPTKIPHDPGGDALLATFNGDPYNQAGDFLIWRSAQNLADNPRNIFKEQIWSALILVQSTPENKFTSDPTSWAKPVLEHDTQPYEGTQNVLIFRKSAAKPTGNNLPTNGLALNEYGGSKWGSNPDTAPGDTSGNLWACFGVFSRQPSTVANNSLVWVQTQNYSAPLPWTALDSDILIAYNKSVSTNTPFAPTVTPATWSTLVDAEDVHGGYYTDAADVPSYPVIVWVAVAVRTKGVWGPWRVMQWSPPDLIDFNAPKYVQWQLSGASYAVGSGGAQVNCRQAITGTFSMSSLQLPSGKYKITVNIPVANETESIIWLRFQEQVQGGGVFERRKINVHIYDNFDASTYLFQKTIVFTYNLVATSTYAFLASVNLGSPTTIGFPLDSNDWGGIVLEKLPA